MPKKNSNGFPKTFLIDYQGKIGIFECGKNFLSSFTESIRKKIESIRKKRA